MLIRVMGSHRKLMSTNHILLLLMINTIYEKLGSNKLLSRKVVGLKRTPEHRSINVFDENSFQNDNCFDKGKGAG